MKEGAKTAAFAITTVVLAILAWGTAPPEQDEGVFEEQGEKFFPDFTDPLAATSLEVIEYVESQAMQKPFKVHWKDGRWTIPSHHDYPADAKDRLKKTAAAVIDLVKDALRSDRKEDHEALGVLDPLDPKAPLKGRGKRVTLRDKNGRVLADLIIGASAGREGVRYARVPGQNRVYATRFKEEISAKFSDWIETDLLQLDAWQIAKIRINSYSIDEAAGEIRNWQEIPLSKSDSGTWSMDGLAADEELATDRVNNLTSALDDLKIVGVRPKPAGLSEDLKRQENIEITRENVISLQRKGFYLTREGLYSGEGELNVEMKNGVVYTLRFGEVLVGQGEEIEAGTGEDRPPEDGQPPAEKKGTEGRYLMVTARFEPKLLPEPTAEEPKPEATEEEKKRIQEENERKKKDWEEKVKNGQKRAKELSERFAKWFYVIPAEAYDKVRLTRADLVRKKAAPAKDESAPAEPPK